MKVRKEFLLALFILFAIPVIGYFVLHRAADDRMKISASLQPKDSLSLDFQVHYLNAEGVPTTSKLVDMPYILKVIGTKENTLDPEQIDKIMYIINDRADLAFLMKEPVLRNTAKDRVMDYQPEGDSIYAVGDILLVDAFNRVLQMYQSDDPALYGRLLEDISYAFPMVDYRIEKLSAGEKSQ